MGEKWSCGFFSAEINLFPVGKEKNITPEVVFGDPVKCSALRCMLDFRQKDHENDGRMDFHLTDCGLEDIFRDRNQTGCLFARHRFGGNGRPNSSRPCFSS